MVEAPAPLLFDWPLFSNLVALSLLLLLPKSPILGSFGCITAERELQGGLGAAKSPPCLEAGSYCSLMLGLVWLPTGAMSTLKYVKLFYALYRKGVTLLERGF